METKITLKKLDFLCKSLMNWDQKDVETRFHGKWEEIIEELIRFDEQDIELFFTGFFVKILLWILL